MTTRHNLCPNPACKNNVTGWGGGSTPSQATGLTGFPDRSTGASYTSGTFMTGPVVSVTAGQTITFSIYARSNSFNVNSGTIYIQWQDASTVSTGYTLTAGTVKRVSLTATVPAGKTSAQIVLDGQNYTSSSGDYTELLYEVAGSADTYFDGDSTNGSWDGTNGNSASTLTDALAVDLTGNGIASSEAFGTAQLNLGLSMTGIASAETFGTSQLNFTLSMTGIPSAQAFGSLTLTGGASVASSGMDLQGELNRLAKTYGYGEALAANVWAGTSSLDTVGAINAKAGTSGLDLDGACNAAAGTTGLAAPGALQTIATP